MMVESLKNEGTLHSSSNLLKICVRMGASWSAQDFRQAGVTPSGSGAFLLLIFLETWCTSSSLICSAGVGEVGVAGGVNGVFSNLQYNSFRLSAFWGRIQKNLTEDKKCIQKTTAEQILRSS